MLGLLLSAGIRTVPRGNMKEEDYLEDLGMGGRRILRWILRK
jgi:hypothetical protein